MPMGEIIETNALQISQAAGSAGYIILLAKDHGKPTIEGISSGEVLIPAKIIRRGTFEGNKVLTLVSRLVK